MCDAYNRQLGVVNTLSISSSSHPPGLEYPDMSTAYQWDTHTHFTALDS